VKGNVRIGQDSRTSHHFVAIGDRAYLIPCSCDAFIMTFSRKSEYFPEVEMALESGNIDTIVRVIREYEEFVKSVDDYISFLAGTLQDFVKEMAFDPELVDVWAEFTDVEELTL